MGLGEAYRGQRSLVCCVTLLGPFATLGPDILSSNSSLPRMGPGRVTLRMSEKQQRHPSLWP